jgi:hypothetical protein
MSVDELQEGAPEAGSAIHYHRNPDIPFDGGFSSASLPEKLCPGAKFNSGHWGRKS